jgi:hypothetical protein
MTRRRAATLAAALMCLPAVAAPSVALGADVGSATVRALASAAARGDQSALAQLRTVTAVDGRPAALGELLGPGTTAQLRLRALALARDGGGAVTQPPVPAARAQAAAAEILRGARYGRPTVSDPLVNALGKLGTWLATLAAGTPGGPVAFWALAAAAVLALAVYGARRALRRLEPDASAATAGAARGAEDPAALERDAGSAEERGAFGEAVRLRFRAGLLRLGARSTIEYRPSLLTAEVARSLHSPQFDSLNDTFERIAYGGAAARPGDAEASRNGWAAVLSRREARQ